LLFFLRNNLFHEESNIAGLNLLLDGSLTMKSKKVWVTLLVSLLVITLGFSIQSVKADSNNPIGNSGGLTIYSPVNTTYNSNFLSLRLSFGSGGVPATINYSLDGKYSGARAIGLLNGLIQLILV
jgi:hypothetical protein